MHPGWHEEESPWKVKHIVWLLKRNDLLPTTVCEVGCGAGEVLRLLQAQMPPTCQLLGYDVSPQALDRCRGKSNARLNFKLADFTRENVGGLDLVLVLDVVEHLEDYFTFLRDLKPKGRYKIFQIPLEISVQGVLLGKIFLNNRERHGHLHHFTKETVLRTLEDVGYRILDYVYAPEYDLDTDLVQTRFINIFRRLLLPIHGDWTVRLFGGCRIMILAE